MIWTRSDTSVQTPFGRRRRGDPAMKAAGCLLALTMSWALPAAEGRGEDGSKSAAEDCERMAAFPEDPAARFEGVPENRIAMPLALTKCRAAVASAPGSPVHVFLLGRTLLAAGQTSEGLERLKQAGELGYAAAWFLVGQILQTQNAREAAAEAYEKAAVLGHPKAQLEIGAHYAYSANPLATPEQMGKAVHWLTRASQNGEADAAALLGSFYLLGNGVDYDPDRGLRMIEDAVAAGSQRGVSFLGMAHLVAPAGDQELGERLLAEQARKGDLAGLIVYSSFLDFEDPEDLERAIRLFCKVEEPGAKLFEVYAGLPLVCEES